MMTEIERKFIAGNGEMGKWGNGEMGKWGNGEMGEWGNGGISTKTLKPQNPTTNTQHPYFKLKKHLCV
jgi:hypothetical protein